MIIEIANITVGKQFRKIDPQRVKEIADSIGQIGLINPVQVYAKGDKRSKKVFLAAGRHRLEAVKSLGETSIRAEQVQEKWAELIEIDENLMRAELSEIERARLLKRRKAIFDARNSVKKIDTTPGRPKGFDADTAEKTGMTRQAVHKTRKRAENIADDVQEAIADRDDSGVELDALASLSHDEQRQAVERVQSGADKSFREARDFIRGESAEDEKRQKQLTALRRAWASASNDVREQFWNEISGWKKVA